MARLTVLIGLVLIVIMASGCPRRIEEVSKGDIPDNPRVVVHRGETENPQDDDQNLGTDDDQDTAEAMESDAPGDGDGDELADDSGAGQEQEGEDSTPGDEENDASEPDGEVTPGDQPEEDQPVPTEETGNDELTDPEPGQAVEDVVEEEFEAPSFTPEPPKVKLSREALAFVGGWQALVFDFNGNSEAATSERFVYLNDSGSFEATALNRDGQLETGIWGMDNGTLELSFGPAGDKEYSIDQPADNIAIWHGPSGGAMFCIRLPDETTAMSPAERYESSFGPVEFSRSGPGYWKGSYGDPEGNLVLQNAGQFLFGTWEQGKQSGYAILEFNRRGFEGYWWYSGQTSFGGEWVGESE